MASSGYFRSDEPVPDVAVGYLRRTERKPHGAATSSVPVIGSGDGGAHATPRDLDRFLRAIASGDLLGGDVSAPMRSRHVHVADGSGTGTASTSVPTGSLGHGGGDPGIETVARHIPDRDLTVVALCNGEGTLNEVWPLVLSAL